MEVQIKLFVCTDLIDLIYSHASQSALLSNVSTSISTVQIFDKGEMFNNCIMKPTMKIFSMENFCWTANASKLSNLSGFLLFKHMCI